MRNAMRARPALTSVIGGLLFALVVVAFGGAHITAPADLLLPGLIGLVFGASMFAASHSGRRS
jgi:hypothetical protein